MRYIMHQKIKVAIIDNGINEFYLKGRVEKSIFVDENGICIEDTKNIAQQQFQHGTNCAMILEKYCLDCNLISIRVLDENGKGAIGGIYPALEWCYKNQVRLVNLSLGTVDFRDCKKLKLLINEYAVKGIIIIAATSNSGFVTYPASFTNVIGVATTGSSLNYCKDYIQMGIDTVVPSEHRIKIYDEEIETSLSNSYAAPYVCALVANKLKTNKTFNINIIKKYVKKQSRMEINEWGYEPDWVYKAYILSNGKKSRAHYYFESIQGKCSEVWGEIDTLIAFCMADLEHLDIKKKNLIYLGKDDINNIDVQGFFWSRKTRQQQILNNHYQGKGLDVPVVILTIKAEMDSFFILTELRRAFANGGYNAYTIGMEPECVLYALEYMPEPLSDYEMWKNFIESQVFYKQSDLVIWSVTLEDREKFLKVFPDYDLEVSFYNKGENIFVDFWGKEEKTEKKISGLIDKDDIKEIYHTIETRLTEDEDG